MMKFFSKNYKKDEPKLKISDSLKKAIDKDKLNSRLVISPSLHNNSNQINVPTLFNENKAFENERDFNFLEKYIVERKNGKEIKDSVYGINGNFSSKYGANFHPDIYLSNTFFDSGSGMTITNNEPKRISLEERKYRANSDFRITFRSTENLTTEEAISFTKTLISEANKKGLALRAKNSLEYDFLILYIDKEDLNSMINILEDLKNESKYGTLVSNATKHFGNVQPFSAVVSNRPYYGISMAHPELPFKTQTNLVNSYGAVGEGGTFNGYMSIIVDKAYDNLVKNGYDVNVKSLYNEIRKQHNIYMLGESQSELPLWMNRRNYVDYKNMKLNETTIIQYHL